MCDFLQIWQFADQGRTGFLSRVEFYNALKLVTVAQTGREITPELVRAALTGPAAAQIPPPRINTPAGQAGGPGGAPAAAPTSQGPIPVQGAGPPAAQGMANGQQAQARSLQGSNGGVSGRPASTQGNGLAGPQGAYGGAPAKQFSPHTNSAPSAPMPQGGYGGPAKQLAPQTNSLSAGGSGVPQLTSQTSSLSRYPPSAGQVQVAPTGFAQQGWARPPAGGAPARPSLGSLFTTNSAWPPKESNPSTGTSQGSGSTSGSTGPSVLTTPSSGQSRPLTPASSGASMVNNANVGAGTTTTTAPASAPAPVPAPVSSSAKDAGAGFNAGIDLFSGGFKATPTSDVASSAAGSGPAVVMVSASQPAKPAPVTPPVQSKPAAVAVKQLDESMFSAPAVPSVPSMQIPAQGGGRGPGAVATPQGPGALWPQMSGNDVQRYTRVFTKVDTDKDGKITGEQARELFLSWQLPRGRVDRCVARG